MLFLMAKHKQKVNVVGGWRYKAKARVNRGVGIVSQSQRGCNAAFPYFASVSNVCAWQTAQNLGGWGTFSGAVTDTPWLCGRGFPNSDLFYDLNFKNEKNELDFHEEVSLKHDPIQFSRNNITIPAIDGYMSANGRDVFNSLEIIVWKPVHDLINNIEDTVANESEYLWQGKIELINGKAIVTGNFPEDSYKLVRDDLNGGFKIVFNKVSIIADLPEGMNGQEDEIVVSIISDGGAKEQSVLSRLESETINDIKITFDIYPNPSADIININFHPKTVGTGSVVLYNSLGQREFVIYEGEFTKENKFSFSLANNNMQTGVYFILIQTNGEQFIKQVTYQK